MPQPFYTPDARYTGDAATQHRANFDADQWRQSFGASLEGLSQERTNYAQGLNTAHQQAQAPGLQYQMQDNRRQQAFQQARQGTRKGSADLSGRANVQQGYAQALAQSAQQGQGIQQRQQATDMDWINALRMQGLQGQPEQNLQLQLAGNNSQARMGQAQQDSNFAQTRYADQLAARTYQSQLIGGQMSQAGGIINTAGRVGVGPQWMQDYSRVLAGG